jgi:hypothetical protein
MRGRLLSVVIVLGSLAPSWTGQKQKKPAPAPPPPAALTEEEKEILKNRELLEKLDLLRNFEKVKYLDFLAERKEKEKPQPPKAATKPK